MMKVMAIDKEVSIKLANMSLVCAVFVLLIHTPCPEDSGIFRLMMQYVMPGAAKTIANSFFFCAAGFFIGGHILTPGWIWREIGKRIKSLIVPYVFLNCVWFTACLLFYHSAFDFGSLMSALGIGERSCPAIAPLWFVRALILYVLTLPIIVPILKRGKVYAYSVCGLMCIE